MRIPWAITLLSAAALAAGQPERFQAAEACALCHSRIAPPEGASVSGAASIAPHALWSGSMKAHAARDPYWKSKVGFETALTPAARDVIEDKCLRCHAPAQQYDYRRQSKAMRLAELDSAGAEGATCTVCHQIAAKGLGSRGSFTGGFEINDRREIYGPHQNPFTMPMLHHTGYEAVESRHILEASLCATCHTVITPSLAADGKVIGEFVEQAPFLEWLASGYPQSGSTCQSCHMPHLKNSSGQDVAQFIAHRPPGGPFPPTEPRAPFGLHFFVGGNVQVPAMIAELNPSEAGMLRRTSERASEFLKRALKLDAAASRSGGKLRVRVTTSNLAGHKLPTAYPSRRLWLHLVVTAQDGRKLFESGAWNSGAGEITGIGSSQPHHRQITDASQAMVYEAEYRDAAGERTTSLLRTTGYLKDNRILPRGYDTRRSLPAGIAAPAIAPVGVNQDDDFQAGSDTVEYVMDTGTALAPFKVSVEALFQSIKPSHVAGLDSSFVELHRRHGAPAVIGRVELTAVR